MTIGIGIIFRFFSFTTRWIINKIRNLFLSKNEQINQALKLGQKICINHNPVEIMPRDKDLSKPYINVFICPKCKEIYFDVARGYRVVKYDDGTYNAEKLPARNWPNIASRDNY